MGVICPDTFPLKVPLFTTCTPQAAMPSPFYFFDEVDAALDTMNAARVAEYMAMGGLCINTQPNRSTQSPSAFTPDTRATEINKFAALPGTAANEAGAEMWAAAAGVGDCFQGARPEGSLQAYIQQQHLQQRQKQAHVTRGQGPQFIVVSHRPQWSEVGLNAAEPIQLDFYAE
eukprot:scaffold161587_cov22-Tisochrysis_lutea.AAC.1